jgi:5-methyltetrahydrofolate--homocysteine methyltransferase
MRLEFKSDFERVCADWESFWQGRNKRPMVWSVLPKPGVIPVQKPPYASGHDGRFEPVIDQLLAWAASHEFLADAIPFYYLEFAASHFAALLGADIRYHDDGHGFGWVVPFVEDWDSVELRFRPESQWWARTAAFAQELRRRCEGRLLIAAPTLVANLDALEAVRGAQNLLIDLVDRPDAVHRALEQVTLAHQEILDALADLLDFRTWGSITRHGMYSTGRVGVPQCDFSCMISPEMVREFLLPYLRLEIEHYDGAEYHLDGPGAIPHLEAICSIEKLGVIQWIAGSGEPSTRDWTWLFERIDALGKGAILSGDSQAVQRQWRTCKSRRLYFQLQAASRAEVDDCLQCLEDAEK